MRVNTDKNCNIIIHDDTLYPINGLSYEESVSLYVVQLNQASKSTIIYLKLDPHKGSDGKPIILSPLREGFITVCHIIIPKTPSTSTSTYLKVKNKITKNLINRLFGLGSYINERIPLTEAYVEQSSYITLNLIRNLFDLDPIHEIIKTFTEPYVKTSNFITKGLVARLFGGLQQTYSFNSTGNTLIGTGYYSDGQSIYYTDGTTNREVSVTEILEINPGAYNFVKQTLNFFSVCYLRKCYVSLCKKIFLSKGFDRCFNGKIDPQSSYKRDLVWGALNVILYMIDSNQLAEAQRLLERINGCNGLCSKEETGDLGCGCES